MVNWKAIILLSIAWMFIVGYATATSDYCAPQENFTTIIDHSGSWFNITIISADCYVCSDNGAGYGDVDCVPCGSLAPITAFTTNVTCGIVPVAVQFADTSFGSNITDWYWDFGDGNTSIERNPIYQYNMTGVFTVSHSATNEHGTSWRNESSLIHSRPVGDTCTESAGYATYEVRGSNGIAWASPFILAGAGIGLLFVRRKKDGNGGI
jgi:PKD repeat protein